MTVPTSLRRSADRKVTNAVSPNGKTAAIANAFGLPSGRAFTCPGATSACESVCYAGKLEKIYKGVRDVLTGNLALLREAGAPGGEVGRVGMAAHLAVMVSEFVADCDKMDAKRAKRDLPPVSRAFRIHWDGDFFSVDYADAWARVMRAFPEVSFWVYTRSFHTADGCVDVLPTLKGLPNLSLYLSVDPVNLPHAVGARKRHPWARWAYLADTFADGREDLADYEGKRFPCPENGGRIPLISEKGSACIRCGICPDARGDVIFSIRKR